MNPLISNIEGKRQYFQQQYGNKIERTLLDITDAWKELEADPELFSLLARDLGESSSVLRRNVQLLQSHSYFLSVRKFSVRESEADASFTHTCLACNRSLTRLVRYRSGLMPSVMASADDD